MNADGSGQRNLTRQPAGDGHPVCSPDGRTIGFFSNRAGNRDCIPESLRTFSVGPSNVAYKSEVVWP